MQVWLTELKQNMDGAVDHAPFCSRLDWLGERVGGLAMLAARADIPSHRLQAFLQNAEEPTGSELVALATAGDVAAAWLAAGEGQPTSYRTRHVKPQRFTSNAFRARLTLMVDLNGGIDALATALCVRRRRLADWLAGDQEPVRPMFILLAEASGVRLQWLLSGCGSMRGAHKPVTRRYAATTLPAPHLW